MIERQVLEIDRGVQIALEAVAEVDLVAGVVALVVGVFASNAVEPCVTRLADIDMGARPPGERPIAEL